MARDNNEIELKLYYKVLSKVIKEAKKLYYIEVIIKSKIKMKATWNIVPKEKGKPTNENNIKSFRIKNHIVHNQINIANESNDFFKHSGEY